MTKANGAAIGITMYKILLSLLLSLGGGCGATLDDEGVTEGDKGVGEDVKGVEEDDKVKVTLAIEVTFEADEVIFAVVDVFDEDGVTEMLEGDKIKRELEEAVAVIFMLADDTNSFKVPQFDALNTYKNNLHTHDNRKHTMYKQAKLQY